VKQNKHNHPAAIQHERVPIQNILKACKLSCIYLLNSIVGIVSQLGRVQLSRVRVRVATSNGSDLKIEPVRVTTTKTINDLRKEFGPIDLRTKNDNEVYAYEIETDGERINTMERISLTDLVESLTMNEQFYITFKPAQ
jgi:hypothetical protein